MAAMNEDTLDGHHDGAGDSNESQDTGAVTVDDDYVSAVCNHAIREDDKCHSGCEGCRAEANSGRLCSMTVRCKQCKDLSADAFAAIIKSRERNRRKLEKKRARQELQSGSTPSSPAPKSARFASRAVSESPTKDAATGDAVDLSRRRSPRAHPKPSPTPRSSLSTFMTPADATFNKCVAAKVHLISFCQEHGLDPDTPRVAASSAIMMDTPLQAVSGMAAVMRKKFLQFLEEEKRQHEPTASTSKAGVFVSSTPIPKVPGTVIRKVIRETQAKKQNASTSSASASKPPLSDSSTESASEDEDVDVPVVFTRDLPTPPRLDQSFDAPPVDPTPHTESPMLRQMLQFLGSYVDGIEAVPVPSARASGIRSMLQAPIEGSDRYCLTTSPCSKACVEQRQQELLKAPAKEYMRVTTSEVLKVKQAAYAAGDKVWSLESPPPPEGFAPWLPTLERNHKVPLCYNDVCSLETTARVGQKVASDLEITLCGLTKYLAPVAQDPMAQQIHQHLASCTRDIIKSFASLSTSLFQVRRDLVLSASGLPATERKLLRYSPYVGAESLFDPVMLSELCETARKHKQDEALQRSFQ